MQTPSTSSPQPTELPPGPPGNALTHTWKWMRRPVEMLEECRSQFGARFTLKFSRGRRWVFLGDPADVKAVFAGDPEVFLSGRANEGMRPFFGGDSLFVIDGEQHRRHRRF